MAILSAGVVMNVIFAFVCATAAYSLGVNETACGVSAVIPGETAWRADLRPGDRVLRIGDHGPPLRFRDLMSAVALGDLTNGVDFVIERQGDREPIRVNLKPEKSKNRLLPTIGVLSPRTTQLRENPIVTGGTPAAAGRFRPEDTIVAVGGTPVKTYADLVAQLVRHADQPLVFTVERLVENPQNDSQTTKRVDIEVAPQPMRTLGLAMTMGKITAVQDDSPAAAAGLRAGDTIETIDGQSPGDPLRLPDLLRPRAGETITLVVAREDASGKKETLTKEIKLRDRPWPEESVMPGNPVSVPALGLAYEVLPIVRDVEPDSPAAKAELTKNEKPSASPHFAAGDEIVEASFEFPELSESQRAERAADKSQIWPTQPREPLDFSEASWPYFATLLQQLPNGTKITLTTNDGRTATLVAQPADDWFYHDRGIQTGPDTMVLRADSLSQAVALGGRETTEMLLMVYRFLRRLGSQVSPFALGGPLTIASAAGSAASEGPAALLLFLTMLSANLAVINFLPIPLLDGGHMVFLILEGIMRRPVSEKVVIAFHYAGFVFIISLMLFVLVLDVNRIF
jgi:regulator of sigma E protease